MLWLEQWKGKEVRRGVSHGDMTRLALAAIPAWVTVELPDDTLHWIRSLDVAIRFEMYGFELQCDINYMHDAHVANLNPIRGAKCYLYPKVASFRRGSQP
jgi:hypothetical protein